ncbi:hypothetical protein HNQ07_002794 [Deinococcus metalli]|uniref:Leucine rich repeat variant n=1 Tax=Deinococcus metalli TaxID=1141878 RepID=A0A7W8KFR2_9DEIO|nr:hypothetical protein [Deinococcus metalli]MBB5377321.1 hypothetical protein [Deinococcus metalli]GHF47389.1 hypothetical protein GCM10017781_24530 [Deinococcus metalli]
MLPDERATLDPHLTAAELANLSLHRNAGVRRAVAAHPNTPAAILGTLAAGFPAEVLGNPALPLLRLAQPDMVGRWPVPSLLALLQLGDAPGWLLAALRRHPSVEVQVALARHPRLGAETVETLAAHTAWLVRARIAARPDLPPALLRRLLHDPDDSVRLAVASRTDLGPTERGALGGDPSRFVRQVLRQCQGRTGAAVDS